MVKLSTRSYQPELLDDPAIPFADIQQNMKELNTVNTYLGGHAISIAGVKKLTRKVSDKKSILICEIGCGGGDNLNAIAKWCIRKKLQARFIGIDINPACISFAKSQYPLLDAEWICCDYILAEFKNSRPNIIFSSLFCHHFKDDALHFMLQWMKANCRTGFFINDLHRHILAYYSIKWITAIFSTSYLVKNDAPLSVARGFIKSDWQKLLQTAGITNHRIQWKWAFRHLITFTHGS